jgi:cytochrome P450
MSHRDVFFEMLEAKDPHPLLHRLRAEEPVHLVEPGGFWLVTRHADVKRLFNDPDYASADKRLWEHYERPPAGSLRRDSDDNGLLALSRADHDRIRRLVSRAFTPRAVLRMEDQIREVVARVAAPLRDRPGEVLDLLGEFAAIVPNAVISRWTGVPPGDDERRFRELAQSVIAGFFPLTPPDAVARADRAFTELSAWVRELCAKRRAEPREDMVSDLVQVQEGDDRLSTKDVVGLISGLIGAGSETTALAICAIFPLLLQHPEALERLRANRALLFDAMDELLRFSLGGPAGQVRFAACDFELRGRSIRKGQMLMLSMGGANRDPEVYAEPDRLDLDREVQELLVFGNGPHYCLGANLARREIGCMLDALLDIAPAGSRVRDDCRQFQDAGLLRRPLDLPVEIARATSLG